MCSATDQARLRPHWSCSKNISALASMTLKWLRHNAYIRDSRLLHSIHYRCKSAERHVFIGANKDGLVLRITHLLPQLGRNLIDIDGVISEEDALLLADADAQPLFSDLFHGLRLGHTHLDARLQHRRGHHKNDEEHENHVY